MRVELNGAWNWKHMFYLLNQSNSQAFVKQYKSLWSLNSAAATCASRFYKLTTKNWNEIRGHKKKTKIALKSFEATAREKIGIDLTHILERFFYFRIHMDGSFLMAFKHNKSLKWKKETQLTFCYVLGVADLQPTTNSNTYHSESTQDFESNEKCLQNTTKDSSCSFFDSHRERFSFHLPHLNKKSNKSSQWICFSSASSPLRLHHTTKIF